MKLSKLYSNKSELFQPIKFLPGLNVILAEIRLPENRKKDTHNLGKTTLGRLLDFCFLANRDPEFFLFKHYKIFCDFIFFLEIELPDGSYLTVRRSVRESSKISFKKHVLNYQDFSNLIANEWDHFNLPFERAKDLMDSLLDWRALKPWSYRKGLGYQLRSQDDYRDVFQLHRFSGKHADWKPYLSHILGFNSNIVDSLYKKESELEEKKETERTIKNELRGTVEDISKIEGILLLKQKEVEKKQGLLDSFDFRLEDKDFNRKLIEEINNRIAELNEKRYSLSQNRRKILQSLEDDQLLFNPDEAQRLFKQAGILFQGQIKKDFQQLIEFNRAITDERRGYLQEEYDGIEAEIKQINIELNLLGKKSSESLSFLSDTDIFNKYKKLSDDIVLLKADITSLERQRDFIHRLQVLRSEIRELNNKCNKLQIQIEENVELQNADKNSLFSFLRLYFSEIVEDVITRKALLSVSPNKEGHLQFKAQILDELGNTTSADLGHTYRKLLCIAFDLALLRAHINEKFPRFVYHDGVFESLDDRKKENLLTVTRQYTSYGIQSIITLIDSDIPPQKELKEPFFDDNEVILRLHDIDEYGRLFKMDSW